MKVLQVTEIDAATLLGRLNVIEDHLYLLKTQFEPKEPPKYITRKDLADLFSVSTVTISDWTKKGILKAYKIANRVYYKREEVEAALVHIKSGNNE